MVVKADFTFEEWVTLRAVLDSTLLNITLADKIVRNEEARVWSRLSAYTIPLVQALLARGQDPDEDQAVVEKASHIGLQHLISDALAILQDKASREEIRDLSRTLRALARAVAEVDNDLALKEVRFLDGLDELLRDWES